jgi:hypothetical protein
VRERLSAGAEAAAAAAGDHITHISGCSIKIAAFEWQKVDTMLVSGQQGGLNKLA